MTTIVYDGDGGPGTKTVGTQTTTYIGKLYVCGGTACAKMIFGGGQRSAIKQVGSGSISYFHPDHLGSTSVLTNGSGVKEEDLVYYPYGDTFTNAGTANVAYKYTGKELDGSTELYFYEARYYDAVLGRFISADTIVPNPGNPQDFNRYTYGNNNPILFNDPTGRFGIKSITNAFKKATRKLKNTLGSPGFTVLSFGIQVGIVPVPFLSPIQSGILGTGLLTQSKSGRYVLAGEIIVGTAVGVAACSAGTAGACSPAAAAALQGALAAEISLGATGGLSAARNGGDISKGVLFGTVTGAVGGLSGGTLNNFGVIDPFTGVVNLPSLETFGTFVTGTTISGAFLGAGKGATESYAGGRGNLASIIHGASRSALREAAFAPITNLGSGFISEKIFGGLGSTDLSFTFDANIPMVGFSEGIPYGLTLNFNPIVGTFRQTYGFLGDSLSIGVRNAIVDAGFRVMP